MNGQPLLCEIATTAMASVSRILERDQRLAQRLRSETTTSRQIFREECITTEMAATLSENYSSNVEMTLFTGHEERANGADWYWRFESDLGAIHAFVQAKRVQRTEFGQADLDGRVDINADQLTQLVNSSSSIQGAQAWFLTYARCAARPPCGMEQLAECQNHNHIPPCHSDPSASIWIAKAENILRENNTSLSVRQVVSSSLRIDCLLPCLFGQAGSNSQGPKEKGFRLETKEKLTPYDECIRMIREKRDVYKNIEGALRIGI